MKKVNVFKYTGIFIGVLIITFVVMTYVSEYIYSMIGARVNFSLSFIVIEFVKFGIIYDLTFGLVIDAGEVKHLRCGAEGIPSLKRATVSIDRPETG